MHVDIAALPLRLREKIYIEPNTGCWLWMGYVRKEGYGRATLHQKTDDVHRIVWELLIGKRPRVLHHTCASKNCCNPAHLKRIESHADHALEHRQIYCVSGRHLMSETRNERGQCKECYNEWMRNYRRLHPDIMAEYDRKRYERLKSDPEAYRRRYKKPKQDKTHREAHAMQIRKSQALYREKNREALNRAKREMRAKEKLAKQTELWP